MSEEEEDSPKETGGSRDDKGRFVPGVSGNPEGRPKDSVSALTALKRVARTHPDKLYDACLAVLQKAIDEGDVKALNLYLDRLDGPVKQAIEHSGGLSGSVHIRKNFIVNERKRDENDEPEKTEQ